MVTMEKEHQFAIALSCIMQWSAKHVVVLKSFFGSLEQAWAGSQEEWHRLGFSEKRVDKFFLERSEIHPEQEYELVKKHGVSTVLCDDELYPHLLTQIPQAPALLYYLGTLPAQTMTCLAVVGTRKVSTYGESATQLLVRPLAQAGYCIVSGLAYGIDTCAHRIALDVGGCTVAVLANGLDRDSIYPSANIPLAKRIIEHGGCVMSEYPIGTKPQKAYFPLRNRIVAGMSSGVLVIEAPEKSGALITAFSALEQNREVCAVPGPITHRNSAGTNMLLKMGAHVVTCASDIFRALGDDTEDEERTQKDPVVLGEIEQKIYDCVSDEAMRVDDICARIQLDIQTINSTLGIMELNGLIKNVGGMRYIRSM